MAEKVSWSYKLKDTAHELQDSPAYCVSFNSIDPQHFKLLASCSGRRVTIYDCVPDGKLEPIQGYMDDKDAEQFFVVKWSRDSQTGAPLLLAAGHLGQIRILNCHHQSLLWTAVGHGSAVNDIAIHSTDHDLFATASKDCSIRLWNWRTQVCVAIISGDEAHSNEVLSVDFNPFEPSRLLSGAMDDHVKIWSLEDIEGDIMRSKAHNLEADRSFRTVHMTHPVFSSRKIHWNYVDCVRWMGDIVVSKSVDNRILMWQDVDHNESHGKARARLARTGVHLLQEFNFDDADIWYIRFSMDLYYKMMACGSRFGRLFVWDLSAKSTVAGRPKTVLKCPVSRPDKATIRQTAISADGSIIVASCDDASVHRFDRVTKGSSVPPGQQARDSGRSTPAPSGT